ncbi:hypothetical protein EI94DRAFT_1704422 [Lactarius quietus]|nr:hypothetical protein EI94DRAFT_1704422 [Lactarius quietus]
MPSQLPHPSPFTLRPHRDTHPGIIDMPRGRRSTDQVHTERMEKEKEKLAHVQSRKTTIAKTAQMEADIRRTYEDKRRHAHNPPPVATAHVPRPCLPSMSSEEPDFDQVDKVQCQQDSEDLEEGEVDTVGAHDGIDDDEPQELLDPSGDEQPKTQKRKTASKKGELRE